ncbi:50S ribosome-binding GTPase [Candidatus Pacearchaeota archaeon]|nr:50S ribosome-binding GTPase [Candidatus Pacearchaeota archaeon]
MPINAGPEYLNAEKEYLNSVSVEDKIYWLEEMIKKAPKHKSSENFLAELKTRLKKFREKAEKAAKKSKGKKGIRKEGFQFVLVGKTNSGKSLLLSRLTNALPKVASYHFTTLKPEIGTFDFDGVKAQVIDLPSIGSENFDSGIVNTADCLLIVVENLEDMAEIDSFVKRNRGKKIVVFNKSDKFSDVELRKIRERMKSRKIEGVIVSAMTGRGVDELSMMMFGVMGMIRVYLKEPGREAKGEPMVLNERAKVKDVAEKIFKGFSEKVKEVRLTGPSGKFPNQKVGLNHELKDKDVVEFHVR